MTGFRSLLAALSLTVAFAPAALAAHTHVPSPSTWTLNLKETDFGGGPSFKGDIDQILVDNDNELHWVDVVTLENGAKFKSSWDGPEDGTFKPIVGNDGGKASWNTADDSEHITLADGSVTDAVMTLSEDKKRMTLTQTVKEKDGTVFHQKLVYSRIK